VLDLQKFDRPAASTLQRTQQMHAVIALPAHKRARLHDADHEAGGFECNLIVAAPSAAQSRDHQQRNERRSDARRSMREELIFRTASAESQRADYISQQKQQLADDWQRQLAAACRPCPQL
jgi:hypothetical protein